MKTRNKISGILEENKYLLLCVFVYKLFIEVGFWFLTQPVYEGLKRYHFEFDLFKWTIGTLGCLVLFLVLKHKERTPSIFFLQLMYLVMIVPMAVILGLGDGNIIFFILTCIGFIYAEFIVQSCNITINLANKYLSRLLIAGLWLSLIVVIIGIVAKNGMFTFEAINIYNVYNVRGRFQLNKYIWYMFTWQYSVIVPFFIVKYLDKKKYLGSIVFLVIQFVFYLYSGQKGILFVIPLIVIGYYLGKLKVFNKLFIYGASIGVSLVTIGAFFWNVLYQCQDLFVRRVLILPAWLKYLYYDFFQNNPTMGLAGTLWGKFLETEQPYEEGIGYIISDMYFGLPEVNSNTGFIAEGMSRFGEAGVLLVFILLAFVLIVIDNFAKRNGYSFAISISMFSVILLNDGAIIDTLIFGYLTILVIIGLTYDSKHDIQIKGGWAGKKGRQV